MNNVVGTGEIEFSASGHNFELRNLNTNLHVIYLRYFVLCVSVLSSLEMLESCVTIICEYWGLHTGLIEDPLLLQGGCDSVSHPTRPEFSTIARLKNKLSLQFIFVIHLVKNFRICFVCGYIRFFFAPEVTTVDHKTSCVF